MSEPSRSLGFNHKHLLGIEDLQPFEIADLLERADGFVDLNRRSDKKLQILKGLTQINLFFESSTRTQTSFELAGKRLGADVVNMSVASSAMKKGETLIDTAMTLNAMHPDVLVVRHSSAGAAALLTLVKLVGLPALALTIAWQLQLPPFSAGAAVLCAAVPTAKTLFILSSEYGTGRELVAATIALTTLASVASLLTWLVLLANLYPSVFPAAPA